MLTITLLGTAATMPLPERALTAAVAECGGHSLLLDCGEGTQTAARPTTTETISLVCPGFCRPLGRRDAPVRWCCWGRRGFWRSGGRCML